MYFFFFFFLAKAFLAVFISYFLGLNGGRVSPAVSSVEMPASLGYLIHLLFL